MERLWNGAKILVAVSFAFLSIALGIAVLRLAPQMRQSFVKLNALLDSSQKTVDRANLTLKETDYLILKAGLTADTAQKASAKELVMLDDWNAQITHTLGDLDQAVRTTNASVSALALHSASTLDQTTKTLSSIPPTLNAAQETLNSANRLLSDPAIHKTLLNFETTSQNAAIISTTAKDTVEHYAHPPKKKLGFWAGVWAVAQVIHKLSPPLF